MRHVRHLVKFLPLVVLYIGVFSGVLKASEPDLDQLEKQKLVYVEPTHISKIKVDGEYRLDPYVKRRNDWGGSFGFGYSTYEPLNMEPSFSNQPYNVVYGRASVGMLEARLGLKRNLAMGSLGGELIVGTYSNQNSDNLYGAPKITLIPVHVGGSFYLDTLNPEPWYVPYISGGAYMMIFREELSGNVDRGNTMVAPYINGGIAFTLDWIDRHAARVSYESSRVQSSFVYVEARKYFASSEKKDPDFSNSVCFNLGVNVEF